MFLCCMILRKDRIFGDIPIYLGELKNLKTMLAHFLLPDSSYEGSQDVIGLFGFQKELVNSDDALIEKVCSKTTEPVVCSECLKSDPQSPTADARGLAEIAVNCAQSDTMQLYEEMTRYADNMTDGPLKNLVLYCAYQFHEARDNFDGVRHDVDAGVYDHAKSTVSKDILSSVNYCIGQFEKSPTYPLPPTLLSGTDIVNHLCNVVTGILNYLTG